MGPTLLVCKPVFREKFVLEDYVGQDDILALVASGSFVYDNGSGPQQVGPLEAVNFKAGVTYHRHITQPAEIYMFRYRSDSDIFGSGTVRFRDQARIRSTLELLGISDTLVYPGDFAAKRALFDDLVNLYRLENAAQLADETQGDPLIRSAVAHINSRLHQKLSLAQLADEHYMSYIQFSRRFKRATGSTPQDYVAGLRLKKAQLLLSDTDLPVRQIARDCGFANEYYFSNFFRQHCDLSPTQYRAMVKTADAQTHS